jgi:hypothetical protein
MKLIGLLLVVISSISLIYGGIQYKQQHTVAQIGDLKATTTETKHLQIPPLAGVVGLVAGLGLIFMDSRKGNSAS